MRETWMNYDSVGQEVTVVFTVAAHGLGSPPVIGIINECGR